MTASEKGKETAAKLVNNLQDISLTKIALIIFGTWLAVYLTRKILPYLAKRGPSQFCLYFLGAEPIIRLFFFVAAIIWVIPIIFNITVQNFLVIAGAASVAIGFAFKDYVSSLIAGIVAIFERPYRPGDWVEINGDYGEVRTVGLRAIQLETAADNIITVPHATIWTKTFPTPTTGRAPCVASPTSISRPITTRLERGPRCRMSLLPAPILITTSLS